jgi:DNA-binding transcriptional MerR regulator
MLPDIDLYMDQVLALSEKYFGAFSDSNEVGITSSMLNNYVKQKVIPAPDKKRYNKEHLARFLMICILKRVLSIAKIKQLFDSLFETYTVREVYEVFSNELDCALHALADNEPMAQPDSADSNILALKYAVRSFAHTVFAEINMNSKND